MFYVKIPLAVPTFPFGKYKGHLITVVPVSYVEWFYCNVKNAPEVNAYIAENYEEWRELFLNMYEEKCRGYIEIRSYTYYNNEAVDIDDLLYYANE